MGSFEHGFDLRKKKKKEEEAGSKIRPVSGVRKYSVIFTV
jgi:hypothetical protein